MKKLLALILFAVLVPALVFAGPPPSPPIVVEEADGSPSGAVVKFVFTNAAVTSITNGVATIDVGAGAGSPMTLDLGNDGSDSTDLAKIATTGDTNLIFTESSPDNLLIDLTKAWPVADQAKTGDSATAFFSSGTIEAARLPVTSASTAGLVPTTNGVTDGWVIAKQSDGSAAWAASSAGVTTMAALTDAGIAGPADGHILIWNTDSWDNKAVSGDVTLSAAGAVAIANDKITEAMLKAVDAASDEDVLTYESTTGDFEWHSRNEVVSGATVVAPADGTLWDLSGITHTGAATEGLVIPNYANVVPGADKKYLAADGSNLKLYNGGWVTIGATAAPTDASYLTLANDATLSAERVLTEGLAIDFTDAGANSTLTIAFDPTELTGDRTWAAGGAASITWTWNNSGGTDPSVTMGDGLFTFNQAVTVTSTLTANGGIVMGTGDGFTVNGVNLLSGNELDGTKIKDADYGDVTIDVNGVWSVENDSHSHGSTTLTLASTNLSDTSSLAYLAGSQTFTGNNVFGNGDTDTLTLRSLLAGGNSRAVQVTDTLATPTYATTATDLYVKRYIEAGSGIYTPFIQIINTGGESYIDLLSNAASPTGAGTNALFFVTNTAYVRENGTDKIIVTADKSATWTGGTHSFSGVTNLLLPTADADASGEISINRTGNQLVWHDGAAVIKIDTTSIADNKILKWSAASGAFLPADDDTAGAPILSTVGNPTSDTTFTFPAGNEINFVFSGNFTTGSQFLVQQVTGAPSGGTLFEVRGVDSDITLAKLGDGTNGVQVSYTGALTATGSGSITATALSGAVTGATSVAATTYIAVGADPADAGAIRLPNAGYIYSEAAPTGTDISVIGVDASEIVQIAASGAAGVNVGAKLTTPATATGSAGFNLPAGTAPNTPSDGDVWTTTAGMYVRINGGTVGPLAASGAATSVTGANAETITNSVNGKWAFAGVGQTNNEDLVMDFETTANQVILTSTTGVTDLNLSGIDLIVGGGDIVLPSATAGVRITGGNGLITFKGEGDGTDEDLTINLNSTNAATISSTTGVANLSFSAINLVTTGTISGLMPTVVENTSTTYNITQAQARAGTFFVNTASGTKTFVLPSAEAGMAVCVRQGQGIATALRADTDGTDYLVLNSTGARTTSAGDYIEWSASAKNQFCAVAFDSTDWYITSETSVGVEQ